MPAPEHLAAVYERRFNAVNQELLNKELQLVQTEAALADARQLAQDIQRQLNEAQARVRELEALPPTADEED